MAKNPKRGRRTEALSVRLDPKDKFILDYAVRFTGMGITTVIERAIQSYVNEITDLKKATSWESFWDVSEGVRTLKMLNDPDVPTTFEEDELVQFVEAHLDFFYLQRDAEIFSTEQIEVLWPKIHEYVDMWRKAKNPYSDSVGKVMVKDLEAAGAPSPTWPKPLPF